MSNKREILAALCAQGQKLGLTPTEFWFRVRHYQKGHPDDTDEEAATALLQDLRSARKGAVACTKCGGTGRFIVRGEDRGACFRCKGKGYEDKDDIRRNYGHRTHNPTRHVINSPSN